MIKVVMADMDGTLLNEKTEITDYTASVIRAFQEKGGLFVINTGRSYETASHLLKDTGIVCDYICLSGAGIYDHKGSCLWSDSMDPEDVKFVAGVGQKYGLYINYLTGIGVCAEITKEEGRNFYLREAVVNQYIAANGPLAAENTDLLKKLTSDQAVAAITPEQKENLLVRYQNILKIVKYESVIDDLLKQQIPVYKMAMVASDKETLAAAKEEMSKNPNLKVVFSNGLSIEANSARVDKGAAALAYLKEKNIDLDEVMALGDNENDIAMLSLPLGKTVAMENSAEKIRKICSDVTLSNQEDGVAYAIEQWVFS